MNEIEVKPGQIWADNDKRCQYRRELEVVRLEGDYVWLREGARMIRVLKRRMRPTSTGYCLVRDAE